MTAYKKETLQAKRGDTEACVMLDLDAIRKRWEGAMWNSAAYHDVKDLYEEVVRLRTETAKRQVTLALRDPQDYDPAEVLDHAPLGTAEEERERAKNWLRTAALHLRNEKYWEERTETAEAGWQKAHPEDFLHRPPGLDPKEEKQ